MAAYPQDSRNRALDVPSAGNAPAWLRKHGKRTTLQAGGYRPFRVVHLEQALQSWTMPGKAAMLAAMREKRAIHAP